MRSDNKLNVFGMDRELFVENFRRFRRINGLSYEDMSRLLGVSVSTVYRWEKGKTLPYSTVIYRAMEREGIIRHVVR